MNAHIQGPFILIRDFYFIMEKAYRSNCVNWVQERNEKKKENIFFFFFFTIFFVISLYYLCYLEVPYEQAETCWGETDLLKKEEEAGGSSYNPPGTQHLTTLLGHNPPLTSAHKFTEEFHWLCHCSRLFAVVFAELSGSIPRPTATAPLQASAHCTLGTAGLLSTLWGAHNAAPEMPQIAGDVLAIFEKLWRGGHL